MGEERIWKQMWVIGNRMDLGDVHRSILRISLKFVGSKWWNIERCERWRSYVRRLIFDHLALVLRFDHSRDFDWNSWERWSDISYPLKSWDFWDCWVISQGGGYVWTPDWHVRETVGSKNWKPIMICLRIFKMG
jgi:hypothetical protein